MEDLHGSGARPLWAKMGQEGEVQDFGAEALDVAGAPERAGGLGGLHTCVHTHQHTWGCAQVCKCTSHLSLGSLSAFRWRLGDPRNTEGAENCPLPSSHSCQDPGCALWPLLERTPVLTCVQVCIAGTGPPQALGSALHLTSSEHRLPGPIGWDHCTCISMHACAPH